MTSPEEVEELTLAIYDINESFLLLQAKGQCGDLTGTGRRCKNAILEYVPLDSHSYRVAEKVGACGMHLEGVKKRVKRMEESYYGRQVRDYIREEAERLSAALRLAGIYTEVITKGYGPNQEVTLGLKNPQQFLERLHEIGYFEQLQIMFDLMPPEPDPVPEPDQNGQLTNEPATGGSFT